MYKVVNLLTYREWQVSSRDELLAELELLNARKKPLDPIDTLEIIHLSPKDEILGQIHLQLPFEGTIDLKLEGFGYEKNRLQPFQFFKGLFGSKTRQPATNPNTQTRSAVSDAPTEQGSVGQHDVELDRILELTSQLPEDQPPQVVEEDKSVRNIETPLPTATVSKEIVAAPQVTTPPVEPEPIKEKQVSQAPTLDPVLKITSVADVENLSPKRLQQQYVTHIQSEIHQMDELISRLQHQRQGHIALLEHIEKFDPSQALVD